MKDNVARECTRDKLHSGSKHGPPMHNPKQAIAIAYSKWRHGHK